MAPQNERMASSKLSFWGRIVKVDLVHFVRSPGPNFRFERTAGIMNLSCPGTTL